MKSSYWTVPLTCSTLILFAACTSSKPTLHITTSQAGGGVPLFLFSGQSTNLLYLTSSNSCGNRPLILCHPEDQCVQSGSTNVSFSVSADSTPPYLANNFTYQWEKSVYPGLSNYVNLNVATATNPVLVLSNVGTNDVAYYRVAVTWEGETVYSLPASLTVWTTNSPVTVWGAPVYSPGSSGSCPGCYSSYVNYKKTAAAGWGWAPDPSTSPHKARDLFPPSDEDTRVEYVGISGDSGCAKIEVTVSTNLSSKFRFSIYFPCGYVNTRTPYALELTGFLP